MSANRSLLSVLVIVIYSSVVTTFVFAETRLTYESSRPKVTIGKMVMPAVIDTSFVWIGRDVARIEKGDGSIFIFDRKSSAAYRLFPKFEIYESTSFSPSRPDTIPASTEANMMAGLSQLTETSKAQIEPTLDTATVGGYLCRKFLLSEIKTGMITVQKKSEVWATTAIDVDFTLYRAIMNISDLIASGDLEMLDNLAKIEGVFVRRIGKIEPSSDPDSLMPVVTVGGNDILELLKVETLPAPDSLFVIPPGYTKSVE